MPDPEKRLSPFERYLTLWVGLCMVAGVAIGKSLPGVTGALRGMELGEGSQINVDRRPDLADDLPDDAQNRFLERPQSDENGRRASWLHCSSYGYRELQRCIQQDIN